MYLKEVYSDLLKPYPAYEREKLKRKLKKFSSLGMLKLTDAFLSSLSRPNSKKLKKEFHIGDPDIIAILRFSVFSGARLFFNKAFINSVKSNEEEFTLADGCLISTVDLWTVVCDVLSLKKNLEVMFDSGKLKPYRGLDTGELSIPNIVLNLENCFCGGVIKFDQIESLLRVAIRIADGHLQKGFSDLREKDKRNRLRICLMGVGKLLENIDLKDFDEVYYWLDCLMKFVQLVSLGESKDLAEEFGRAHRSGKRHSKIIGYCGNYLDGLLEHLEWDQQIDLQRNVRQYFDFPLPCLITQEEETDPMDISDLLLQCIDGKLDGFCLV